MVQIPFCLYDAFSHQPFGGSQAGIISDAARLDGETRQLIASELGYPATCFVSDITGTSVSARFHSTKREYPMCGHGTVCLMTHLVETGRFDWQGQSSICIELQLPQTTTTAEIHRCEDGRPLVMLDIVPPKIRPFDADLKPLSELLGIKPKDFRADLPVELACGDFHHLVVPIAGLDAVGHIKPDFSALATYCLKNKIDTVTTFCSEVENSENALHVRDFCPAVGVDESAAAGTTNAALTTYLITNDRLKAGEDGMISIKSEQGLEIGRPSSILATASIRGSNIARMQIGGVATKVLDGHLYLPDYQVHDQ